MVARSFVSKFAGYHTHPAMTIFGRKIFTGASNSRWGGRGVVHCLAPGDGKWRRCLDQGGGVRDGIIVRHANVRVATPSPVQADSKQAARAGGDTVACAFRLCNTETGSEGRVIEGEGVIPMQVARRWA